MGEIHVGVCVTHVMMSFVVRIIFEYFRVEVKNVGAQLFKKLLG